MGLLRRARTRVGVAVIGGVVLAAGGTATAAVVTSAPTEEVADVSPAPESATPTSEAAPTVEPDVAPQVAPAPQPEPQPVSPPAATVDGVTEPAPVVPEQADAPAVEEPEPYDPTAPWTDSTGRTYIPAPPQVVEPLNGEDVPEPD